MADPITPNAPNVDGQVVTMACSFTSTGATKSDSFNLPTYAPKIDLRIGHPVLSIAYLTTETDSTGSLIFSLGNEMARGTAGDGAGEWNITDFDTVAIYHAADENGIALITYIAFGAQLA